MKLSGCVREGADDFAKYSARSGIDTIGESVRIIRFDQAGARPHGSDGRGVRGTGQGHLPHEDAVRDLLLERSQVVEGPTSRARPGLKSIFQRVIERGGDLAMSTREVDASGSRRPTDGFAVQKWVCQRWIGPFARNSAGLPSIEGKGHRFAKTSPLISAETRQHRP